MPVKRVMFALNEETIANLDIVMKELNANSKSETIRRLINEKVKEIKTTKYQKSPLGIVITYR